MLNVKSLDDTKNIIKQNYSSIDKETELVSIQKAVGRILACDILAREDVPHFKRSTLDGYAVRAEDTFGASEAIPAILNLSGEVKMNSKMDLKLQHGKTIYVPTGGYIPEGADAVAMVEIMEKLGDDILINKSIAPGTGIIFRGDDTKAGEVIIKANQLITPKSIGAFAALGYSQITVKKKLKCGIISTGDELVAIDAAINEDYSSIRDVNSYFLCSQAEEMGCEVITYGICTDNKEKLSDVVKRAYFENDILLVSGGSSVGIMDITRDVFIEAANAQILVHGVAAKPGKPTIVAKSGDKALIGLPGHPVSAFFMMQEVVKCVVDTLSGVKEQTKPYIKAKLTENIVSNNGRDEFVPVTLNSIGDELLASPIKYKSGLITLLSNSDGYIKIPRFTEGLDEGTQVKVFCF